MDLYVIITNCYKNLKVIYFCISHHVINTNKELITLTIINGRLKKDTLLAHGMATW